MAVRVWGPSLGAGRRCLGGGWALNASGSKAEMVETPESPATYVGLSKDLYRGLRGFLGVFIVL